MKKTLQIRAYPTRQQERKLDEYMNQFCKIAREAAIKAPSVPYSMLKKWIKNPKFVGGTPFNEWSKELRKGTHLNAQCATEAVKLGLEAYKSNVEQAKQRAQIENEFIKPTVPKFKDNSILRLHNRDNIDFVKKNKIIFAVLRVIPYKKLWLPLKGSYQYKILNQYQVLKSQKGNENYGSALLKKYFPGHYKLNLTLKGETEKPDYEPETIIGVDLGINNKYVAVTVDENGEYVDSKFQSSGKEKYRTLRYINKKKEYQEKRIRGRMKYELSNFKETKDQEHSRHLVDWIKQFDKPLVVFEDLEGIRENLNEVYSSYTDMKDLLNHWSFYRFRTFLEYKLDNEGIKHKQISKKETKGTSNKCYKCGESVRRPHKSNWELCYCPNCKEERNADFNGAMNILKETIVNSVEEKI